MPPRKRAAKPDADALHPSDRVRLGVITAPHGVTGAVRIKSFADTPKDVAAYGPLSDEAGKASYALAVIGESRGAVLARIDGVRTREDAEALRGKTLWVPRDALPPTEPEEYYHADLIGLRAVTAEGHAVGTVRAVHDFGAGALLEIEPEDGAPFHLAFTRDAVPEIDIEAGQLVVMLPEEA